MRILCVQYLKGCMICQLYNDFLESINYIHDSQESICISTEMQMKQQPRSKMDRIQSMCYYTSILFGRLNAYQYLFHRVCLFRSCFSEENNGKLLLLTTFHLHDVNQIFTQAINCMSFSRHISSVTITHAIYIFNVIYEKKSSDHSYRRQYGSVVESSQVTNKSI